jgi:hypothetical protein
MTLMSKAARMCGFALLYALAACSGQTPAQQAAGIKAGIEAIGCVAAVGSAAAPIVGGSQSDLEKAAQAAGVVSAAAQAPICAQAAVDGASAIPVAAATGPITNQSLTPAAVPATAP